MIKRCLTAIAVLALCGTAVADDLTPVTWYDASSNAYSVACYWREQFPNKEPNAGKHLLVALPQATWLSGNPSKRNKIESAIRRWLSGSESVTQASLVALSNNLNDATCRVVMTDDPLAQLAAWGLAAPTNAAAQLTDEGL